MASLYTVMFELAEGEITTKLDQFFQKYRDRYPEELMDIVRRLNSLGKETGCTENFFKLDEGLNPDDMVCALYDVPEINLRLYCIRLDDQLTILGDGGPKATRTWQEDANLKKEVHAMMDVSMVLRTKLKNGTIKRSANGLRLDGDLWITKT
ncbi:hypothetical protein CLV53_105167 [Sediminibacterium magnilacihabitans]|nr:hypothetical protein CLV53_105167 [Sediminibacterium magnilacihabitans]